MYVYRCSVICIYTVSHVHTNHMHIIVCEDVSVHICGSGLIWVCNCISEHMHKGWAVRGRHSGRLQKIPHYDWFLRAMDWKNHLGLFEGWGESLCVHRDLLGWMKTTVSWCQKPGFLGRVSIWPQLPHALLVICNPQPHLCMEFWSGPPNSPGAGMSKFRPMDLAWECLSLQSFCLCFKILTQKVWVGVWDPAF